MAFGSSSSRKLLNLILKNYKVESKEKGGGGVDDKEGAPLSDSGCRKERRGQCKLVERRVLRLWANLS